MRAAPRWALFAALLTAACGSASEHRSPAKPVYIAVAADGTVTVDGEAVPEGEDPMDYIRRRLGLPEASD